MTPEPARNSSRPRALYDNAYLLLAMASLCWSGNHLMGRAIAGHVPPLTISSLRWLLAAAVLFPFIRAQLARDWPVIRSHLGVLVYLALIGGGVFGALQFVGLQLTTALNAILAQSEVQPAADEKAPPITPPLTLRLIIDKTGERAFGVLAAFLCLPFLTPLPLPGMSILFGLALALLGIEIAVRRDRPWLPQKMLNWKLPPKLGPKLIAFVARLFRPLEKIIRPRLLFMQNPIAMIFVGIALALDGLLLALPLPPVVPLSNAIPAWLALITILGITEEDGLCLLTGTILTLSAVITSILSIILFWNQFWTWLLHFFHYAPPATAPALFCAF